MAHQATNIPWNTLASNLQWSVSKDPDNGDYRDLRLRLNPGQGKKLHYFVEAMTRNLREHSLTSRKKYPEHYDPPLPEDIILDDATVRKINPTVHRLRLRCHARWGQYSPALKPSAYPTCGAICQHQGGEEECRCPIPYEDRRAASFYKKYRSNQCYKFFDYYYSYTDMPLGAPVLLQLIYKGNRTL